MPQHRTTPSSSLVFEGFSGIRRGLRFAVDAAFFATLATDLDLEGILKDLWEQAFINKQMLQICWHLCYALNLGVACSDPIPLSVRLETHTHRICCTLIVHPTPHVPHHNPPTSTTTQTALASPSNTTQHSDTTRQPTCSCCLCCASLLRHRLRCWRTVKLS